MHKSSQARAAVVVAAAAALPAFFFFFFAMYNVTTEQILILISKHFSTLQVCKEMSEEEKSVTRLKAEKKRGARGAAEKRRAKKWAKWQSRAVSQAVSRSCSQRAAVARSCINHTKWQHLKCHTAAEFKTKASTLNCINGWAQHLRQSWMQHTTLCVCARVCVWQVLPAKENEWVCQLNLLLEQLSRHICRYISSTAFFSIPLFYFPAFLLYFFFLHICRPSFVVVFSSG